MMLYAPVLCSSEPHKCRLQYLQQVSVGNQQQYLSGITGFQRTQHTQPAP